MHYMVLQSYRAQKLNMHVYTYGHMTVEIHGSLPDSLLEKASLPELLVRAAAPYRHDW
jgi:hypothetical protein